MKPESYAESVLMKGQGTDKQFSRMALLLGSMCLTNHTYMLSCLALLA